MKKNGTGSGLARRPTAGEVLAAASIAPAVALTGWLLAGLPLLIAGAFTPLAAVPLGTAVAAALWWWGPRRSSPVIEAGVWSVAGVFGVAVVSAVVNGLLHSEQLVVRRDPATYAQYAIWLAEHGSLPIPRREAAFGGPHPGLIFASSGFYDVDGAVLPQFMAGPPLIFTVGHWLGGIGGMLLTPPLLGALGTLAVAGAAARLVGARWAPLAALLHAVALPIFYTSRTTFSEIPSSILLFGGLCLLLDARERLRGGVPSGPSPSRSGAARPYGGARRVAALAGLVLGTATLVRIDGLRDILPVVAYAGLLLALSRVPRSADRGLAADASLSAPLLAGLAVGVAAGFLGGLTLSRPYLEYLRGSLVPLLAVCATVLVLTALAVLLGPRLARTRPSAARTGRAGAAGEGPPGEGGGGAAETDRPAGAGGPRWRRALPDAVAAVVVLATLGFAARPLIHTVRREPDNPADALTAAFVGAIQRANGLPHDPTRLYYEESFHWVVWYAGPVVVVLASLAAAVLARRLVRGAELHWLPPLVTIGWATATTLLIPAITPDHPFASRRLVPLVLPGVILLGVWGLRLLHDRARRAGRGPRALRAIGTAGVILAVAPPVVVSAGTALEPVERGEAAAVAAMCEAIPRDASVLIVERVTGDRFTQVVRGMCGVPTARVRIPGGSVSPSGGQEEADSGKDVPQGASGGSAREGRSREPRDGTDVAPREEVERLIERVRAAGRRPVLLAAEESQLAAYGRPHRVFHLRTRQDDRSLSAPPNAPWSLSIDVWAAFP